MNRSALSRAKDAALEKALLLWLRTRFRRYGEIRRLTLDTSAKLLTAEIKLHGEAVPLTVSEVHYRLEQNGNTTYIVLHGVKLSREWAQNLLEDHFREIRLKIPDFVRPLLE